ncbi:hypothetical protein B4064_0924 [Caldibacillus thermoamylovorans]|nr:hypothetical protein B4064_0924 [Caldibacillus thermoamylovorans]
MFFSGLVTKGTIGEEVFYSVTFAFSNAYFVEETSLTATFSDSNFPIRQIFESFSNTVTFPDSNAYFG